MKQLLQYSLINGLFGACVYAGVILGMEGPLNIALAFGWLSVAIAPFIFTKSIQKVIQESPTCKRMVDAAFDTAVSLVFIWHGFIWLGVLYLMHQLFVFSCWIGSKTTAGSDSPE